MAYLFWTILIFLFGSTVLYFTKHIWLPYAPPIPYITAPGTVPDRIYDIGVSVSAWSERMFSRSRYVRLPTSFHDDAEAGFSSSNFDLAGNIDGDDARAGLDDAGKLEVQRIMRSENLGFDEARRLYVEERFGRNNIGRDGRPLDPKAVMFDK